MSAINTKARVLAVAVALGVLGLAAASLIGPARGTSGPGETIERAVHASWANYYKRPAALARDVDAIVVARLTGTSPGRVAVGDSPQDKVPFELAHFKVERALKGSTGPTVVVERVGGVVEGQRVVFQSDGGPYVVGQRYALFLKKQPATGLYYLINDQGRYSLGSSGLKPVAESGRVTEAFSGKTLSQFTSMIVRYLNH